MSFIFAAVLLVISCPSFTMNAYSDDITQLLSKLAKIDGRESLQPLQELYGTASKQNVELGFRVLSQVVDDSNLPNTTRAIAAKMLGKQMADVLTIESEAGKEIPSNVIDIILRVLDFSRKRFTNDADVHLNFALLAITYSSRYGETEDIVLINALVSLKCAENVSFPENRENIEILSPLFAKLFQRVKENDFKQVLAAYEKLCIQRDITDFYIRTKPIYSDFGNQESYKSVSMRWIHAAARQGLPSLCAYMSVFGAMLMQIDANLW